MSGKRGEGLERVGGLVRGVLRACGLSEAVERASVVPGWAECVGPEIARVSAPTGFDGPTLFVAVRSSAWLMELEMMERRLLARLNEGRSSGRFERIVFKLSETD